MGGRGSSVGIPSGTSYKGRKSNSDRRLNTMMFNPIGTTKGSKRNVNLTLNNFDRKTFGAGKETLAIMDDKGRVSHAFKGKSGSVTPDVEGYNASKNSHVIHNHPSKTWGGTFSPADVNYLVNSGAKSVRAVAREGSYILRPRKGVTQSSKIVKDYSMVSKNVHKNNNLSGKANRQYQTGQYHKWLKDNASNYGYEYIYLKRK